MKMKMSFKKGIFSEVEEIEEVRIKFEKILSEPIHFFYDGESQIATVSLRQNSIYRGKHFFKKGISTKVLLDKSLLLKKGSYYSLVVEEVFIYAPAVIFVRGKIINEDGILSRGYEGFSCSRFIHWDDLKNSEVRCHKDNVVSYVSPIRDSEKTAIYISENPELFSDEEKAIYARMAKRLERQKNLGEKLKSLGERKNFNGTLCFCTKEISTKYHTDQCFQHDISLQELLKVAEAGGWIRVIPETRYRGYRISGGELFVGSFSYLVKEKFLQIEKVEHGEICVSKKKERSKFISERYFDKNWGYGYIESVENYEYNPATCRVKIFTSLVVFEITLNWEMNKEITSYRPAPIT